VQHGEEHRTFQPEAMTAAARQGGDHTLTAGLHPESLEQQCRTDAAYGYRGYLSGPHRIQHHRLLHEARARAQEAIKLPASLEFIQPSECRDHALTHLITGTVAFDDLQVDASLRLLAAEIHARLGVGAHRLP